MNASLSPNIQNNTAQSKFTATAFSFWTSACAWANYIYEHGKLPPMESDASANVLSEMLSDIERYMWIR